MDYDLVDNFKFLHIDEDYRLPQLLFGECSILCLLSVKMKCERKMMVVIVQQLLIYQITTYPLLELLK